MLEDLPLRRGAQVRSRSLPGFVLLVLMLPLVFGMAECNVPLGPSSPVTFTLEPGESVRIERTTVEFIEVVSDSRCPLNALCVHPGDVVVEIDLTVGGSSDRFELALDDENLSSVVHRGVVVTLLAVQPYPAGSPIDPDDYRATFEVVRD